MKVFDSALLISLGVAADFKNAPYLLRFPLDEELQLEDGELLNRMETHIYNYDRTLAPEGKSVIVVTINTKNADYWIDLRKNNYQEYLKLKKVIADKVITILDKKLGNVKANLEITDVATPATFYRYTGNWKGSIQGWMPEKLFGVPIKNTLPGLKNFYMTGQWLEPGGGVPIALSTSRNLAQILCKKDKKNFRTDAV
jgi:phytoene dehydrogenase-like protein